MYVYIYIYIGLESFLSMGRKTSTQQMPTTKSKQPFIFVSLVPEFQTCGAAHWFVHAQRNGSATTIFFSVGGAIRDNFTVNEHMNNHVQVCSHGFDVCFVYYIFHAFADIEVLPLLLSLPAWGCIPMSKWWVSVEYPTSNVVPSGYSIASLPAGMRI